MRAGEVFRRGMRMGVEQQTHLVEVGKSETMIRFVLTLIVSTLMVAVTAWVLSYAVLTSERVGSARGGAAASAQHAHS